MVPPDDCDLMQAVRAGDLVALDTLFVRHHGRLYGFLRRLTGDPDAAEDLTQEVFFRMLRGREGYTGTGYFLAWCYRIARNLAADHYARHRTTEPLGDAPDVVDDEARPMLDLLIAREDRGRLEDALARLPFHHREVLLLRTVDDLSHQDLAAALGCTEGAARVRFHRAVAALRRAWHAPAGESA